MSDASLPKGHLLVGQYEIVREIGRGGMSTVYLANDRKHERTVAVKVLLAELCEAMGVNRFSREIRTVSRLQHPHILPLFDSGAEHGVVFFVMPYIEGESLRQLLDREGSTGLDMATMIARQVRDALDFAHSQGVVHRDVKPENIMLVAGHALLTDFGVARGHSQDQLQTLTAAGAALGTPYYMSPEQASGERNIDGRSDLYALGCITFEMLHGSRPFEGSTPMATMAQHVTKLPPRLIGVRAPVAKEVADAVDCMLHKDPDDRFQSGSSFAAVFELALKDGVVAEESAGHQQTAPRGAHAKVLVFDFANLSRAVDLDWLTVGIAETISVDLRRIDGVRVVGGDTPTRRRMSAALNGAAVDAAIAQRLGKSVGARWVVAGGFQRAGTRLRLTPQFFDVDSGESVGVAKIDGSMDEIFELQDQVVAQLAKQLNIHLTTNEIAQIGKPETARMQAYELYARGRQATLEFGEESMRVADDYFRRAIAIDPQYALAWAGLGSLLMPRLLSTGRFDGLEESVAALKRALELDPALAEPYVYLAYWYAMQYKLDEAIEYAQRAVEHDAGVPLAWYLLAISLYSRGIERKQLGDFVLALPAGLRSRSVGPMFQPAPLFLAALYMLRGDYAHATLFASEAMDIEVSGEGVKFVGSFVMRALLHLHNDERDLARVLFDLAIERYRGVDHLYAETVTAWALFGRGRLAERERDPAAAHGFYTQSRNVADTNQHRAAIGASWVKATLGLARLARLDAGASMHFRDEAVAMIVNRSRFLWNNYPGATLADNWYEVAATEACFGERDAALNALQRAAEHGWADKHQLFADHHFASLRADRDVQRLLERAQSAITLPAPTARSAQ
ncbi:MAG TPA: protein kinase [Gemmatimonas sp.]|nr:protein kinase [Gemmatimonas sp.]